MKLVSLLHRAMETPEAILVCAGPAGGAGAYRYPLAEEYLGVGAKAMMEGLADDGLLVRRPPDFGAGESGPVHYVLTEPLKRVVTKVVERQRYIIESVAAFGFKTVAPSTLTGHSGARHEFFLSASAGLGFLKTLVLIDVLYDDEIGVDEVHALYTKALDVGAYGVVFAALPKISAEACRTAEGYGMACVEAADLVEAAAPIVDRFSALLETPQERALAVFGGLGGQ